MTCVIFKSIDDCDVYFGLCSDTGGVLKGDRVVEPLKGDVGIKGDDEAEDDVFDGVELPEFPIANWKIDFNALLLKTGAVCGVIWVSIGW